MRLPSVSSEVDSNSSLGSSEARSRVMSIVSIGGEAKISNVGTMMGLIKGLVGTGMLSLPLAFKYSGLWLGVFLCAFFILVNIHCMDILVEAAQLLRARTGAITNSYPDTVRNAFDFGPARFRPFAAIARNIITVLICGAQSGACISYVVFVATNIHDVVLHYQPDTAFSDIRYYIAVMYLPFLLISYARQLHLLAKGAVVANAFYLIATAITFVYLFLKINNATDLPAADSQWSNLSLAFGMIMFSFEDINMVLPLENKMKEPEWMGKRFGVLWTGCLLVLIFYVATGFFGYIRFGADVKPTITLNLPNEPLYEAVQIVFSAAVAFSFFLQFYVITNTAHSSYRHRYGHRMSHRVDLIMRTVIVTLIFVIATVVPHLDLIIGLVGSISGATCAMIAPCIVQLLVRSQVNKGRFHLICVYASNAFLICVGLLGIFLGTFSSIKDIIKTFEKS